MKPQLIALLFASALAWTTPASGQVVNNWNVITVSCAGANRPGPTNQLDIALVQGAVHDAVQAIQGRFESYHYVDPSRLGVGSEEAAVAAATYGVLRGLYGPNVACLATVPNPATTYAGDLGLQAGNDAAQAFLPLYRPVFTLATDPFTGGTSPGEWRPTAPAFLPGANTYLAQTEPFTLLRNDQFRPPPPPPLKSEAYRRDYDEVKRLGSLNSTFRTTAQTDIARFWQAFVPQWYSALRGLSSTHLSDIGDQARVFALASYAAADATISAFTAKYHYNFWRPITAIQEGDVDGNPRTDGDPTWLPFLTTPAYPDHPSGANNFTGSFTTILQLFFGTDELDFTVPGPTAAISPRSYHRFSDAQEDVINARIYQGIHFRFADEDAMRQGSRVAHWVFQKFLKPLHGK
ncbi:MAG TPA: vanadium-dependent haloperoxidase [Vicinamibacterales bacterium]|nr:vanadium-dependent haloperoxidase [Vicinamibacterales bacterium]